MINLPPEKYHTARKLFTEQEHHLLIPALFENNLEAQILVDELPSPRVGVIAYNYRFIFGGDPTCNAFNASLRRHFIETVIPARNGAGFVVRISDETWLPALKMIFADYQTMIAPRLYFEITPTSSAPVALPNGFTLHAASAALLESNWRGSDELREEMCSERTSVEDFLEKSFGICPIFENQIVGWCLSEYDTGEGCEIGIATLEPYQRRGLATAVTQAFLAEAFRRGYRRVGWDCWEQNAASVATARKVGFKLVKHEQTMIVMLS